MAISTVKATINGQVYDLTYDATSGAYKATITVVATDGAGKSSTVTRTVILDTHAPVFSQVTIAPNPVDAGATYIITVKVND